MPVAPAFAASPSQSRAGWLRWSTGMVAGLMLAAAAVSPAQARTTMPDRATRVQTPYTHPKVLFDVYLEHPAKMGSALNGRRSLANP